MPPSTTHKSTLISWIGANDLKAAEANGDTGPVLSTLQAASFGAVELLYSYPESRVKPYLDWLGPLTNKPLLRTLRGEYDQRDQD